ncbi:MAG: C4-type zinc ribbon domain-containing protein [Chloroflexi bacterium]|nr:C4-type zinc ribbon domain-containing protein [Chloroflexota bacterium]MCI0580558.1 C4-type zinc ribbon domain-containing protein [Chloroflexota bacterium]MCI0644934.1 C4-type zinc ribbon domain-containing protein [Chloroflexota bacterium]MCI0731161.1 C4-type zinc ribbon domain-containing protein [Chloroflexota bacterium]
MSQVEQLYRLQHMDDEIREKKKRLGEVLRLQKESEELVVARKRAEAAAAALQRWRTRQTDLNLELSGLESKVKRSEDRLYSGMVKNPKELSDLQHEIESLVRRRAALEDEILETMIALEEAQAADGAATAELDGIRAGWERQQQGLKNEQNELARRLNDLTSLRQQQVALVTPAMLARYESIGQKRGGVAVVALRNNMCRGCQTTVPASLVKAVNEGRVVTCDSCDRILCPV